jgi:hypothetical protein
MFCIAKLAQAKGYWFPCQEKVQGMHVDAQHRLWFWQEHQALPSQQIQEICRPQCLWAGAAYDAQQVTFSVLTGGLDNWLLNVVVLLAHSIVVFDLRTA